MCVCVCVCDREGQAMCVCVCVSTNWVYLPFPLKSHLGETPDAPGASNLTPGLIPTAG
jgi:hypothetical protein